VAQTAEEFGKAIIASGLMTAEELKAFWTAIPAGERPKTGPAFAALLVSSGRINDFQVEELLSGGKTPLVLGDHVLVGRIGAGGMGQVFKARHRLMNRGVAVKLLPSAMTQDEAAVKRFQREVQAAARLSHPNIVAAFDAGSQRGVWYLVMEYVEGRDLSALVKERGPLPIEQGVDYVVQAARGLAYAHSEGVIHRDIKPANLLLDKKGTVKILDMGLARFEDASDGLTGTEQVMGTVDYMSPEQAADTKHADARSDVYSLGCTLWYLLTGKRLYDGETMISRLMSHRTDALPSLVKARDDVPWPLEQALHKMIAKRPQDRLPTMDAVVAALAPYGGRGTGGGSATGTGSSTNPELAAFLEGMGPKTLGGASAKGASDMGGRSSVATPRTDAGVDEATAAFVAAEEGTDPKREVLSASALAVTRPAGGGKVARKKPPRKLIAGGIGGLALLVLWGLWAVIGNKPENEAAPTPGPGSGVASAGAAVRSIPAPSGGEMAASPGAVASGSVPPPGDASPVRLPPVPLAADPHRRAAEAVIRLGGKVGINSGDGAGKSCTRLDELPPEPFRLVQVDASGSAGMTDDALQALEGVYYLNSLLLSSTPVGDAGLAKLDDLIVSEQLFLGATRVTAAGCGRMAVRPDLQYVSLNRPSTPWDAAAVTTLLDRLPNLTTIHFQGTELTPESCRELARATSLQSAASPRITATGAAELASVSSLKHIDAALTVPQLGDDAVEPLGRMKGLRSLVLYGTKVTEAGARRLVQLLPDAEVYHPALPRSAAARRALEWALAAKPTVYGYLDDKFGQNLTTLPPGNFLLSRIVFSEQEPPQSGAANLVALRELDMLVWPGLQNADAEAEHLAKLTGLSVLQLKESDLSDAGLERLTALDRLTSLSLYGTPLGDPGCRHLSAFGQLRTLDLSDTSVGDAGLAHLVKLRLLSVLRLQYCRNLSDDGLRHLGDLPSLRELSLGASPIGDGAVAHLKRMTGLRVLYVNGTQITPQGIAELRAALPKCAILADAGWLIPPASPGDASPVRLKPEPPAADPHRRAAEAVIQTEGKVPIFNAVPPYRICATIADLPAEPFLLTDVDLAKLEKLSDADLGMLQGVQSLEGMSLAATKITAAGLAELDHLAVSLWLLSDLPLTAEGVGRLAARPDLRSVNLGRFDRPIDGTTAARLRTFMPQVRFVNLLGYGSANLVLPDGCRELARIDSLRDLLSVHTTAEGVAELAAASGLHTLDLHDSPDLGDECVDSLARGKGLRFVNLYGTKVGADGARRLAETLPEAVIHHPALPTSEAERRAAAWTLARQGSVSGWKSGRNSTITDVSVDEFCVTHVRFPPEKSPTESTANLVGLRGLRNLLWGNLRSADAEVEHLAKLTSLRDLRIADSDLTDAGLTRLTPLENLEVLNLSGSRVSDPGYRQLAVFPELRELYMETTQAGDEALGAIGRLTKLETLRLTRSERVDSDSLRHLVKLGSLRTLQLHGTSIDDLAVVHLISMKSLRQLYVARTGLTLKRIAELRAALPKCAIHTDQGWLIPAGPASASPPAAGAGK